MALLTLNLAQNRKYIVPFQFMTHPTSRQHPYLYEVSYDGVQLHTVRLTPVLKIL